MRAARGYECIVRDLGCVWFFLLAAMMMWGACARLRADCIAGFAFPDMANLFVSLCVVALYLACCWLILHRPSAVARTDGVLPSITALVGTYLPWSIMLFAADQDPSGQNLVSLAFLVIGSGGAIIVIFHLGKSFSIIPQARRLVRAGPYSVVRHPLYLAEEVALLGCLLRFFSPLSLALFLAHCVLQIARILFEENLLRHTFPDYAEYARSTSRLIPYVW
jgi:protein-S-isoprenylcysteine O-methyltransferase Ste14